MSYPRIDTRVTSQQSVYTIVDVANITTTQPGVSGRLSLSICPGKKDQRWNRDLETDLQQIKNNGIQVIVCLIEWTELTMLDIVDYPRRAQEEGFIFYHLPIRDKRAPQLRELNTLVPIIVNHLSRGDNVLVHCRGGLGRAGTICACCLGHFGLQGEAAIQLVRDRRPRAIQTKSQIDTVLAYCRKI